MLNQGTYLCNDVFMAKQFLIIHGWGGSGPESWQTWLANELDARGEKVCYPELPRANNPIRQEWIDALRKVVHQFDPNDELIVLAHSLGPACWIHFETQYPEVVAKKVYLVAPAVQDVGIEEIQNFYPLPKFSPHSETEYIVIGSENDPYIPFEHMTEFAKRYDMSFIHLRGQGHINTASGYGKWPWILDECLS